MTRSLSGGRALLVALAAISLALPLSSYAKAGDTRAAADKDAPAANSPANVPTKVYALPQSIDDHGLVLAWNKPDEYNGITDYKVYMNGKLLGSALDNARHYSPARPYVDRFYAGDLQNVQVKVTQHSFTVDKLKPATTYRFTVRAVLADGKLSAAGPTVEVRTDGIAKICDITKQGAVGDGSTLNTAAIQKTIDSCPEDSVVRVPKGVFKSGALFLKSNMTFEIAEGATLLGSDNAADYPLERGYKLYEYSTTQRPPSLINALDDNNRHAGAFTNIRIIGRGTIDGNGWKRQSAESFTDETGRSLPQYIAGTPKTIATDGILAAAQMQQAVQDGQSAANAYSQRRSSLITARGVHNLYIAGITLRNPAFHGAMVLESENAVVNGIRVETFDVNNGDGVEFGNSQYVTVMNSFFETGDDCVNFAAGTGEEATKQPPQQFAWVFNNYFRRGHGAVVIGSHTGAWITDILAEDNIVNLTWTGLRGKTNNINGGGGQRIVYRDNAHRDLQREGFILTSEYSDPNGVFDYKPASTPGKFKDVLIQHNSLEFTESWQPTPINKNGEKVVVEFNPLVIQGDAKNSVMHEHVVIDDLTLVNTPPIKIDGLRNGLMRGMSFRGYKGEGMPWNVTNAPGMSMQDVKLAPAEKH